MTVEARKHPLACIAHPPRRMSDAGSSRGILRFRRTIPLLSEEIYFETACVDSYVQKQAQKQTGNVYF